MENRNEGSGGWQRCVYSESSEPIMDDEILRPEDFIADWVGSDGTRSKEFEQCRHIWCNHCGSCSYPLSSETPCGNNRATPSRCEHNKVQTAVNVTPEQKGVKFAPEHNELQTANCATDCSSSSDSDETVENSRQQKQNSNAEPRNKTAAGTEWQQAEVQVITWTVRPKNSNISCSLPFPDIPFDCVQIQKTVFKDRQIRLGNESPQMQPNVSDSTNNCIKWKDSPVENPLSKRNALHQTETLHSISNEEPFKSTHSIVNNAGRSPKQRTAKENDPSVRMKPRYSGFKNYDDCREGSRLSQQNSGHNNRQQQWDYQQYANQPTDTGFQCQTCAGRMTERNSTRMESGDETSAPVVHTLAGRQTSNDASKKKSNVIANQTTTSAPATAVGPIKDVSEKITGKEDEHKATSLQEQQHVRTEISVSQVKNDTMAKLYDFGWKLQDSIIPSHVVLQMFKIIYKEWLEARISTLQMLNTLNTKIRGGGNWKASFNTFCDGMNKVAEWAVKILNITPYAHAAQVVQIFPPLLEKIREMVNDSKENAKGDLLSLSNDHDIRVLQRDTHLTSELQAFGILCERKFQDTVQLITKFRDTLIGMEGQIGTCIEDVGLIHFIFRVCDQEAVTRGFMKTLSEAYREFSYFQRESTSLQQAFCSFIDSDPSVLETMRFMEDSSMHWFLNLQETGNDLHRCWTDINSGFHSKTENSEEAFKRIANFIRILETQKNDIDSNVSEIFKKS